MFDAKEKITEIEGYLAKLRKLIVYESKIRFFGRRIVDKQKTDDILCVLEASLPKEYKDYMKKFGAKSLSSYIYLNQLYAVIRNKFFFSTDVYAVKVKKLSNAIATVKHALESDFQKILRNLENL